MEKLPEHRQDEFNNRAFQFINSIIDYNFGEHSNISDLKAWKLNNQVSVIVKAIAYFNTLQIQPRKLKIKEISKFLEYSSFENEENLQYKWAALLANALNPSNESVSLLVFMELLNQISEEELNIIELLYDSSFQESSSKKAELTITYISKKFEFKNNFTQLLVDNLLRLQLIEKATRKKPTSSISDPYFGKMGKDMKEENIVTLSSLGLAFASNIIFEL